MNTAVLGEGHRYYINAIHGDDKHDGKSSKNPWSSFSPVRHIKHSGPVTIVIETPIQLNTPIILEGISGLTIQSVSSSPMTLYAGTMNAIVVNNCSKIVIRDLKLMGSGRLTNNGTGISLTKCTDVLLKKIEVFGFREGGLGIDGGSNICLDSCISHSNGSAGITTYQNVAKAWATNVTIRECIVHNNAGDPKNLTNHSGNGIVVGQTDKCMIERCVAYNNGWAMPRDGNGPVGIWAWSSSRVTIRHCISHDNKSPGLDGGGFDFDGGVVDSIMDSNISYNNDGSGFLMCQYPDASEWRNNRLTNNLSFMDGRKNNHAGIVWYIPDGMQNMHTAIIRNNTIINDRHAIATQGDIPNVRYERNIFVAGNDPFAIHAASSGYTKSKFINNALAGQSLNDIDFADYLGRCLGADSVSGIERTDAGISITAALLPKSIQELMHFRLNNGSRSNRGAFLR